MFKYKFINFLMLCTMSLAVTQAQACDQEDRPDTSQSSASKPRVSDYVVSSFEMVKPKITNHTSPMYAISSNGSVAVGTLDRTNQSYPQVWCSGSEVDYLLDGNNLIYGAALDVSADGSCVVGGVYPSIGASSGVRSVPKAVMWSNRDIKYLQSLEGVGSIAVAISPDGSRIAGNISNQAVLWSGDKVESLGSLNGGRFSKVIKMAKNGKAVIVRAVDGADRQEQERVCIWRKKRGMQPITVIQRDNAHPSYVSSYGFQISEDLSTLVLFDDKKGDIYKKVDKSTTYKHEKTILFPTQSLTSVRKLSNDGEIIFANMHRQGPIILKWRDSTITDINQLIKEQGIIDENTIIDEITGMSSDEKFFIGKSRVEERDPRSPFIRCRDYFWKARIGKD